MSDSLLIALFAPGAFVFLFLMVAILLAILVVVSFIKDVVSGISRFGLKDFIFHGAYTEKMRARNLERRWVLIKNSGKRVRVTPWSERAGGFGSSRNGHPYDPMLSRCWGKYCYLWYDENGDEHFLPEDCVLRYEASMSAALDYEGTWRGRVPQGSPL